jgi:hypothetical protein
MLSEREREREELRHSIHQAIVKGRQSLPPAAHGSSPSSRKKQRAFLVRPRPRGPRAAASAASVGRARRAREAPLFGPLLPLDSPWGRHFGSPLRIAHSLRDLPHFFVRAFYEFCASLSRMLFFVYVFFRELEQSNAPQKPTLSALPIDKLLA